MISVGELRVDWLIFVRGASLHAIPYGNAAGSYTVEASLRRAAGT